MNNKTHNKIMAFDIDGTLLTQDHKILDSTKASIKKLQNAGYHTIICTGRIYYHSVEIAKEIGNIDYIVSCNGAQIYDVQNKEVIYTRPHDPKNAEIIINELDNIGVGAVIYGEHDIYYFHHENDSTSLKLFEGFYRNFKKHLNSAELKDFIKDNKILKVLLYFQDVDKAGIVTKRLREQFKDVAYVVRGSASAVEFSVKGVSKATGVREILKRLSLSPNDLIAIGDSENDIEVLKMANLGIAMGNALEVVKKASDVITKSNDEHGIEYAIDTFILSNDKWKATK